MLKKILIALSLLLFVGNTIYQYTHLSELDINQINTRRSYYPPVLGKLFENKLTQSVSLAQKSLFKLLP